MTDHPRANVPLVLIPQHFGCLIFDRRTSRYMPFDQPSTDLLVNTVDRSFFDLIGELDEASRETQLAFCQRLYTQGFFGVDGRLVADVLAIDPPEGYLAGPLALHLEVIGACNLTCTHCFASPLPRNQNPLALSDIDQLCRDLAAHGCMRLGLTGGEPLMRKDFFDIVDCATGHGLHPCLTTNGLMIDEYIADEFGKRDFVWLNVSLDGATHESNDHVRGEGTFDRVMERLEILRDRARFTLAFTLTSHNAGEIEACAELARDVGAHTAVFRPLYPTGSALQNMELMPTFKQYTRALSKLGEAMSPDANLHAIDPFSPQLRSESRAKVFANNGCGAANLVASVSVQGDVSPCSFLGTGYNAGNIRDQSFSEIWNAGHSFQEIRSMSGQEENNGTQQCFAGGCRARSLSFNGDINAPDPWHEEYLQSGGLPVIHPMSNVRLSAQEGS